MFSKYVCDQLKYYVYRLIDPRNGETFYVGKGTGNRVFQHAKGKLSEEGDELSDKLKRIQEIQRQNFEVAHVIHRHGLLDDKSAFEVEAALIDAYPGVTNAVGGHGSGERGAMHAQQIIEQYEAKEAAFKHKVILITINRSVTERSTYEAVRYAWKIDPKKAEKAEIILAVEKGLIVGTFVAEKWLKALPEHFPGTTEERPGRWGFVGREASEDIAKQYLRHRLPDAMRKRGAANPVRYSY